MGFYFKKFSLLEGMYGQEVPHEMCFSRQILSGKAETQHWSVRLCTGSGRNDFCWQNFYVR